MSDDGAQLDIFAHSRDVMLRNQVVLALEAGDAEAARTACAALAQEFPDDDSLPASRLLVAALDAAGGADLGDHDALSRARWALEHELPPATQRALGDQAAAWLAARWRDLARRAGKIAFDAQRTDNHAAPLWLRGGDWKAAERATAGIESWRRIPAPLGWMLEARLHLLGLQSCWPLLAELAWLAPRRLDELLRRSPDPLLARLLRGFGAAFEGDGDSGDLAWFPAWVLTQQPGWCDSLAAAQAGQHKAPEQALRVLVELLGLERQGRHREIVERRKTLREVHPSLYAAYLSTR